MIGTILYFMVLVVAVMFVALIFAKAERMDKISGYGSYSKFFECFKRAIKNPF